MNSLWHQSWPRVISGYVRDIVMYITSTEKQVRVWCCIFNCLIKADMYITFVFFTCSCVCGCYVYNKIEHCHYNDSKYRGMWVDIFMFAMCQHLYVYNNSCFHMFLDIIRAFKSVSGWYVLEYDDSKKGFIHDIICWYFLWYVCDIVCIWQDWKQVCGCAWLIFLCV